MSRPVWGAWIEIGMAVRDHTQEVHGRAPYGARGLKCRYTESELTAAVVAPRMGRVD